MSRFGTSFFFPYLCIAFGNKSVTFGNIKKPMSITRLGMLLGQLGYTNVQRRINAVKARGWLVYQRNTDEIQALKNSMKEQ